VRVTADEDHRGAMLATVHVPTSGIHSPARRTLDWLRLGLVTLPALAGWLAAAAAHDLFLWIGRHASWRGAGQDAGEAREDGGLSVLVAAEVRAQAGIAAGQHDEPSIDRG
jgi:hypothetical protein